MPADPAGAVVRFCGERREVGPDEVIGIGRDAELVVDDNPFLHRRTLQLHRAAGLWWLANTGSRLAATVADPDGLVQSHLAPGAAVPLVLPTTVVLVSAGSTTYELEVDVTASWTPTGTARAEGGATTLAPPSLTASQFELVLALAEPVLRGTGRGRTELPTNTQAARRLGWTITRFNRKLDNVCQKLARAGVRGLHGGPGALATDRRNRLVEYAVASHLVHREHLALLDEAVARTPVS